MVFIPRKFNEEHYLADLFDPPDELLDAHNYNGFWTNQKDDNKGESELSKEEKEVLVGIKSKIMSLDQKQTRMIYSGLVEIIFSYCYISRSFYGEMEPEASWIIAKISPMLSWVNISHSLFELRFMVSIKCIFSLMFQVRQEKRW